MPHFIIDCSKSICEQADPIKLIQAVHDTADSTELFGPGDIKVRINQFQHYCVGGHSKDFIHVFGNIMEGRTIEQKANLSRAIVTQLKSMFPNVPIISMNIREFEKATYCNRDLI